MNLGEDAIAQLAVGALTIVSGFVGILIGHGLTTRQSIRQQTAERTAVAECFFNEIWSLARLVAILAAASRRAAIQGDPAEIKLMLSNLQAAPTPIFDALATDLVKLDTITRTQIFSFYTTFNAAAAHTRAVAEVEGESASRYRHDLSRGWQITAASTQHALAQLEGQLSLPEYELERLHPTFRILEEVASGRLSDPDVVADRLPLM